MLHSSSFESLVSNVDLFLDESSMFVIYFGRERKKDEMNEWCDDERVFYLKIIWVKCIAMMMISNDDALG